MTRKNWLMAGSGLASVGVLAAAFAIAHAQQPAPPKKDDRAKTTIEVGPKVVIAAPVLPAPAPNPAPEEKDLTKRKVEKPTEEVLAAIRALEEAAKAGTADVSKGVVEGKTKAILASAAATPKTPGTGFVNPKVAPGKVTWHTDFATACAASKLSGKPVLLFQMMGKLDDKFC